MGCGWLTLSRLCFEPTYKELKQNFAFAILGFKSGFEPTYKELKQWIQQESQMYGEFVLSLPIRNWNYRVRSTSKVRETRFEPTYKELKHW